MERTGGQGGAITANQQREIQYRLLKVRAPGGGIPFTRQFTRLGMPRKLYAAEQDRAPVLVDISGLHRDTRLLVIARYWANTSGELQAQISLSKFSEATAIAFQLSARQLL
jgi:hypothetical protein